MRWVLLDFLELVVHVQHVDERSYYALERLWRDCPRLTLDSAEHPQDSPADDPGDGAVAEQPSARPRAEGQQS